MADPKHMYYCKRAEVLVKNLRSHHFEAYFCETRASPIRNLASGMVISTATVRFRTSKRALFGKALTICSVV